jgi:hypothetical protein
MRHHDQTNIGDFVKRVLALGMVGLFSLSGLAACGSDDKDTKSDVKDANAAFCSDLAEYGNDVKALAALDPATATKADYNAAADAVKSSRETLVASGKDLSQAEWTNLQTQVDALSGSLKEAPDDATVSSILTAADAQATTVQGSVATLNTAICTTGATTTTKG